MRALALFLGLVAGAASLAFLGFAQLIWAQSEVSYYVQLALAILLLGNLFLLARKASSRTLGIAVVATALSMAFMPVENRFFTEQIASIALGWLAYSVLLAIFAFGVRNWAIRRGLVSE